MEFFGTLLPFFAFRLLFRGFLPIVDEPLLLLLAAAVDDVFARFSVTLFELAGELEGGPKKSLIVFFRLTLVILDVF